MEMDLKEFSKITTLMFAASLDQTKWITFLEYLSDTMGVRTHMFGHDVDNNLGLDLISSSYDPDFIKSYDEYYASRNLWAPGFFNNSVGAVIPSEAMCSRSEMERSEFYNDWIHPQEDIIAGGGAILFKDESRMFVIGGNIRRKDEKLEQRWLKLLELITPHLQNALSINRIIVGQHVTKNAGREAAILIVDGFKRPVFANDAAQTMLAVGDTLRTNLGGRLEFTTQHAESAFSKTIHSLQRMDADVSSMFEIKDPTGALRYNCRTARFNPGDHNVSPFGLLVSAQKPCVLLTIAKLAKHKTTKHDIMLRFAVTAAEAEIILQIVDGKSPREISDLRKVSIHTVRNQLKSAMSKMNVRRQVDLVRLIV